MNYYFCFIIIILEPERHEKNIETKFMRAKLIINFLNSIINKNLLSNYWLLDIFASLKLYFNAGKN